jgi:hypothetical protein
MTVFGRGKEQESSGDNLNQAAQEAASFLDGMSGHGLDNFNSSSVSTAYLGMVQPSSGAAVNHTPGTWRNSATDENYGSEIEVVVLAFKTVWTERSKDPPFNTVGRYEVGAIYVTVEHPKPGTRGYPKMTNPITGNKVEELFVYACVLKDRPQEGVMYFSPTVGSMKTCKQWNSQLRSQRLKSGRTAPIFGFSWTIGVELVQNPANPKNPNDQITKFTKVRRGESQIEDQFAIDYVEPQLQAANNVALLAAPEMSGDADE